MTSQLLPLLTLLSTLPSQLHLNSSSIDQTNSFHYLAAKIDPPKIPVSDKYVANSCSKFTTDGQLSI